MTDDREFGAEPPRVAGAGRFDPKGGVDPRYAEAVRRQKAERVRLSARRRPILRVVGGTDTETEA